MGQFLQQAGPTARLQQAQQKAQAFFDDHPQQPADVVARRTQHRTQRMPIASIEVAAVHSVLSFELPNDRLDRLASFEQPETAA